MEKGIVIDLGEVKERVSALRSAYAAIAKCSEQLRTISVELALKGVWKEWSDSKPVGTEYSFTYDQMHQTGDCEIDTLVAVVDTLEDYLEEHSRYKCAEREDGILHCKSGVMSREEWEERFWALSDDEWQNLVEQRLVPGSSPAQWQRFEELLLRGKQLQAEGNERLFTDEEILFLGKMDLVRLSEELPAVAEYYMMISE